MNMSPDPVGGIYMGVGIATDHGGFGLKEELVAHLCKAGYEVVDFGAHGLNPSEDYPDFVIPLVQVVAAGKVNQGVAICGSGVGASACANQVRGIRAVLIHDHFSAKQRVSSGIYTGPSPQTGQNPASMGYAKMSKVGCAGSSAL
jgi:hypothetical protein